MQSLQQVCKLLQLKSIKRHATENRFAYLLTHLHKGVSLPALKCSLDQYTSDHTQVLKGFLVIDEIKNDHIYQLLR